MQIYNCFKIVARKKKYLTKGGVNESYGYKIENAFKMAKDGLEMQRGPLSYNFHYLIFLSYTEPNNPERELQVIHNCNVMHCTSSGKSKSRC